MSSLKKNMAYNIAYQVLVIVLPLVTAPYVSRVLGAEGLGTYSYIFSIVTYFGLFGMLGIANHGNRSVALTKADRGKVSQAFCNIYVVQLVTTVIALVVYIIFVSVFFSGNKIVAYIQSIILLSYVLDITWCFFGLEQFAITVTRNAIIKVSTVVAIFLLVKHRDDVWIYAFIMSFGMFFSQLYLWFQLHKYVDFKKPQFAEVKRNIRPILLLFVPAIAYSIYKLLDKVMLGSMTGMAQVGMFDNAEKIINIPSSLITAFGTVMMPRITTLLASSDGERISYLNRISVRYFTILVVGSAFGLAGISSVLAPVYFGPEFTGSAVLIAGLGFSLIFVTWANIIRTQYLIPQQLDRPYVISTLIGAAANLVVNLALIPRFAAVGAMIGTIVAEFAVFFAQLLFVRRQFPMIRYLVPTLWLFPIGAVMAIVVFRIGAVLGPTFMALVIQLVAGGCIYGIGSVLYLWLVRDEFFESILGKFGLNRVRGRHSGKLD
ncbi:polysaccharide biosynthesis protein [Bifidobacterium sp. UTCIF-39]|uniref:flippase n=1 Tax=Bifidobacterium sp. UTCIF-39 TaxID=1465359 RepID=UPI00112CD7BC|nr:flippase [Bifidobacterium sp. UTCIF-39]TPF97429.1 polysaccharide biosynthesis protein [Bifidobacterium sp. UTCIF-39]